MTTTDPTALSLQLAAAGRSGADLSGKQTHNAKLDAVAALVDAAGALTNNGAGVLSWVAAGGGGGGSGPIRTILKTLHATYGDDFTGASLAVKWSRAGNAVSGQESFQVDSDAATPTWMRWTRGATGGWIYQTAPAGDFTLIGCLGGWNGSGVMHGPVIVDSAGTGVGATFYSSPSSYLVTSLTTMAYASNFAQGAGMTNPYDGSRVWLRLRKSGTSYFVSASFDGEKWAPESTALTWAGTPTQIGFGHWFGANPIVDIDAFNVV